MELLSHDLIKLQIDNTISNDFIQKFSKLELNNLNLDQNKKILIGHIFIKTNIVPINNYSKELFMSSTSYITEKNFKLVYPLNSNMELVSSNSLKNPLKYFAKIFKEKYGFTKKFLDNMKVTEIYNYNNIIIYAINISSIQKFKKHKITNTIHLYTDPERNDSLTELYSQIIEPGRNNLSKRFYFFYENLKVSIKERHILERISLT